jgi:hypothetical protein
VTIEGLNTTPHETDSQSGFAAAALAIKLFSSRVSAR